MHIHTYTYIYIDTHIHVHVCVTCTTASSWTSGAVLEKWGKNKDVRQWETIIKNLKISQLLPNYSPFMELQKPIKMTVSSVMQRRCPPGLSHTKPEHRCVVKWLKVCVILSSDWTIKVGQKQVDFLQSVWSVLMRTVPKHQLSPKATPMEIRVFSCLVSRGRSNLLPVHVQ